MTYDEIATELGVTRERVSQIEREALAKLRTEFDRRGIAADVVEALRWLDARRGEASKDHR
jgi:DNA-directed RNA polymerase sigma subunit (sigma70/sigma32)